MDNKWYHKIFNNNQEWVNEMIDSDPDYFQKLSLGQDPDILYIGCSDSRVSATELMGVVPGELFVHRNIANVVINTDNNINAVIQYAIEHLHVKYIIVCGHYECGGITAALNPTDMGQLNSWLQTIRDVYRIHSEELDAITDITKRSDRLAELNVREQCINIMKMDHVQKAWLKTEYPLIYGWVFDVRTGKLIDLKLNMKEIYREVKEIYKIHK